MKVLVVRRRSSGGMLAAISSANSGNETIILEKMESCGRKIRITGKGRCNITNAIDMS